MTSNLFSKMTSVHCAAFSGVADCAHVPCPYRKTLKSAAIGEWTSLEARAHYII